MTRLKLLALIVGWLLYANLSDVPAMLLCLMGVLFVLAADNQQHEGYTPWHKIP